MKGELTAVRSWYGLAGAIAVENELWHLVQVAGIPLPHPPLVNLLLRKGLAKGDRLHLSFLHEFGHLQTLPVTVPHAALMVWLARIGTQPWWQKAMAGVVAHEALWELASEGYVVMQAGQEYRTAYRDRPNFWQRLFWPAMASLVVLGTVFVAWRSKRA